MIMLPCYFIFYFLEGCFNIWMLLHDRAIVIIGNLIWRNAVFIVTQDPNFNALMINKYTTSISMSYILHNTIDPSFQHIVQALNEDNFKSPYCKPLTMWLSQSGVDDLTGRASNVESIYVILHKCRDSQTKRNQTINLFVPYSIPVTRNITLPMCRYQPLMTWFITSPGHQ